MSNRELGGTGEQIAVDYLKKNRYRIHALNFTCPAGEIDIIAEDGDTLVFVEVKTRFSQKYGLPREAVTYQKQRRYGRAALSYLKKIRGFDLKCRFDVIEIGAGSVNHIKNAFPYIK